MQASMLNCLIIIMFPNQSVHECNVITKVYDDAGNLVHFPVNSGSNAYCWFIEKR